ncbi:hypothetical protein [Halococcus qingdaonensis]|uniref:hypothetical protein n=1 Tax=Halococcus qingdaonensis TaxID=224402 RepID=UPI0021163993|nr:hypothetical protein [Halococcus qingdaonensis]
MSADPDARTDVGVDPETEAEMGAAIDPDVDISTANTMRERANESRIKLWVMLGANRLLITALLALFVFVAFVALGVFVYPPFEASLRSADTIETMFSTMIGAIVTATTLVLTISQLVISQENGPLGEQHARMSDTMDFRSYTRDLIGQPMPADPSMFLRVVIDAARRRAEALRSAVADNDDDQLRAEVDEFTESIVGNAEEVDEELDGATFGEFDVLFAALNFNYGWKLFQVERIADDHADSLTDEDHAILDELRTSLSMFGPAREHIKTLYFEWALIDLSQLILYVAVPALVVAAAMLAFVDGSTLTGATIGVPDILWLVAGGFTVTTLPFLLLIAYIARVATIAKRTLAIGPLILRGSQR